MTRPLKGIMEPDSSLFLLHFQLLEKQAVSDLATVKEIAHSFIENGEYTFHKKLEINKLVVDM